MKAKIISRSPLLPSWQRIATLCFDSDFIILSLVGLGSYVSFYWGASRNFKPSSSWITHLGFLCRCSSLKLVASHRSHKTVIFSLIQGAEDPTVILIESPAETVPISSSIGTETSLYALMMDATSDSATSMTSPASSLKSTPTQQKNPGSVKKWKVPGIKCITTVKPNN